MWTVGLTVEIKLRFRYGLVWTVGLTVEIKLRLRDGLVWTEGLSRNNDVFKSGRDLTALHHIVFLPRQEAEVVTSMSFHPTGDFILVGTEHPTSE